MLPVVFTRGSMWRPGTVSTRSDRFVAAAEGVSVLLSAAAGAAAEDAEFGAMRMIERYPAQRAGKARPKIEAWIVGQQRAGDDGRVRRALEFDDHARARTHDGVGR